jgi:hypothetical protein
VQVGAKLQSKTRGLLNATCFRRRCTPWLDFFVIDVGRRLQGQVRGSLVKKGRPRMQMLIWDSFRFWKLVFRHIGCPVDMVWYRHEVPEQMRPTPRLFVFVTG